MITGHAESQGGEGCGRFGWRSLVRTGGSSCSPRPGLG
ncbi:hypothetical protein APASM_1882 [Actinosynnema pretiosum subsp. pretiosum]|nr:hypothetical protein APASM_1882 [Actinosynnema pretiosum subsp. pretiosum]